MNSFFWTMSWVLIIAGGLSIIGSLVSRTYQENQVKYKGKATGTVVEIVADEPDEEGRAAGIHDYFYPVIAYYAHGRLYKERYAKGGNPCPFQMNQKIEIQYDIKRPNRFVIAKKTQMNYLSAGLYYAGLFLCIAGGILFVLFAMRIFGKNS